MGELFVVILFMVAIAFGVIFLFMRGIFRAGARAITKGQEGIADRQPYREALATLNNRLAQGEVSQEEYQRLRAMLERENPT